MLCKLKALCSEVREEWIKKRICTPVQACKITFSICYLTHFNKVLIHTRAHKSKLVVQCCAQGHTVIWEPCGQWKKCYMKRLKSHNCLDCQPGELDTPIAWYCGENYRQQDKMGGWKERNMLCCIFQLRCLDTLCSQRSKKKQDGESATNKWMWHCLEKSQCKKKGTMSSI